MLAFVIAMAVFVLSGFLFWAAMPRRSGGTRWFIGTRWEPYVVVLLVCGIVVSFGVLALTIADLMS